MTDRIRCEFHFRAKAPILYLQFIPVKGMIFEFQDYPNGNLVGRVKRVHYIAKPNRSEDYVFVVMKQTN